jgi:hypothetical protein
MPLGDEIELRAKALAYARGQKGGAVVFALATAHGDLVTLEIDVFDAHREAFEQPQAAAVKKLGDEAVSWLEMLEDKEDLAARQDRGQVLWAARALEARELGHRQVEDATVEKDDGAQRLVLGRGGDPALRGKMVQEGGDIRSGEVPGVTAVEADKLANPLEISFLRTRRVVESAEGSMHGVKEGHEEISGTRDRRRSRPQEDLSPRAKGKLRGRCKNMGTRFFDAWRGSRAA